MELFVKSVKDLDRYLKNIVSKSIVHAIKHADFQFYRAYQTGFFEQTGK